MYGTGEKVLERVARSPARRAAESVCTRVTPILHGSELTEHFGVSGSDVFALGHYPGNPIYPGVLILERLCGLARRLVEREMGEPWEVARIKRVQYLDKVVPGDVVKVQASIKKQDDQGVELALVASVGDTIKTRATLLCTRGARPVAAVTADTDWAPAPSVLSHADLARILPHRYPFLLVDSVQVYEPGQWIRARKVVSRASALFLERQPSLYPLGLAIESFGQAGIALFFLSQPEAPPADIVLGSLSDTELFADIPFGAVLSVEARIDRLLPNAVVFSGFVSMGARVVLRVGSLVAMIDPRQGVPA